MTVFVPHHECDVFVSFAPADNEPPVSGNGSVGWVTHFIDTLNRLLGQKLGKKDWGEMWCSSLHPDEAASTGTDRRLSHSALLVVVLSESYLNSPDCREELTRFVQRLENPEQIVQHVVLVLREAIPRGQWPTEISHLLAHQFASGDGEQDELPQLTSAAPNGDQLYSTRMDDLSTDLALRLNRLRVLAETGSPSEEPAIFLADVTHDLTEQRESVKRYLIQDGFCVFPERWYPRDAESLWAATLEDLKRSMLCVQLLGSQPFEKTTDLPIGVGGLQYQCATEAKIPILQWRSLDIDLETIEASEHRALLQSEHVIAGGLEEFKRKVVQRAHTLCARPATVAASDAAYVVVNAQDVDLPLAGELGNALARHGLACDVQSQEELPLESISASRPGFGGLLIVYGVCPAIWVRQQLWRYRKAMARSEVAPPICAVYEGPPEPKDPVRFKLPKLRIIDGRSRFDEAALDPFIEAVQGRNSK